MKYLLPLIIFPFCTIVYSQTFIGVSQVGKSTIGLITYTSKVLCEKINTENCTEINADYNPNTSILIPEKIDDLTKPIFSKTQIEPCVAILDNPATLNINEAKTARQVCDSINQTKVCSNNLEHVIIAQNYSKIYCSKFLRYQQKLSGKKIIAVDLTKKTAFDLAKQNKINFENSVSLKLKRMKQGQRVIALFTLRNEVKTLTNAQKVILQGRLAPIQGLLQAGSLSSAKSLILAQPIDALITQADKDAIVAEIDRLILL